MVFLRIVMLGSLMWASTSAMADTIERYMNLVDNIPKMAMKADPEAQIWVRSARQIVTLTCESILQTLLAMNKVSTEKGHPIFCLTEHASLDATSLNTLIQTTYTQLTLPKSSKDELSVSEIALMGVQATFPCVSH